MDRPPEATLEDVYGLGALSHGGVDELLDRSLVPRGPDMLYDLAGELGLQADHSILDAGCGDGRRGAELVRRFGCSLVGLEMVAANLDRRGEALDGEVLERARFLQGDVQRQPFEDARFDAVWCRDMLIHVPDLGAAFRECRRVLRPDGWMLVFQMFATPWLSAGDADRLFAPLAAVPRNAEPAYFETCLAEAGWRIDRVHHVRSEWREFEEESGDRRTSRQLLHAARLLREPDWYVAAMGRAAYQAELSDSLWGVYQMIGKLGGRVYVLR